MFLPDLKPKTQNFSLRQPSKLLALCPEILLYILELSLQKPLALISPHQASPTLLICRALYPLARIALYTNVSLTFEKSKAMLVDPKNLLPPHLALHVTSLHARITSAYLAYNSWRSSMLDTLTELQGMCTNLTSISLLVDDCEPSEVTAFLKLPATKQLKITDFHIGASSGSSSSRSRQTYSISTLKASLPFLQPIYMHGAWYSEPLKVGYEDSVYPALGSSFSTLKLRVYTKDVPHIAALLPKCPASRILGIDAIQELTESEWKSILGCQQMRHRILSLSFKGHLDHLQLFPGTEESFDWIHLQSLEIDSEVAPFRTDAHLLQFLPTLPSTLRHLSLNADMDFPDHATNQKLLVRAFSRGFRKASQLNLNSLHLLRLSPFTRGATGLFKILAGRGLRGVIFKASGPHVSIRKWDDAPPPIY